MAEVCRKQGLRAAVSAIAVAVYAVSFAIPAHAVVQDEIQVYTDEINKPGETGMEMHVNTTPSGRKEPDFPREVVPNHGLRITPEFSYGLSRDFELGVYTPLVQRDSDGDWHYAGSKVRLKYLPFQLGEEDVGWYGGANWELGRVGKRFAESRWATELRPIVGYKAKEWHFAFNPIMDWDLSDGRQGWEPTFVPSVRLVKEFWKGISLGAEYYSDMGKISHILPWNQQDNRLYGVIDFDMAPVVFNFGIGRGITDAADKWTAKAIIEIPLQAKAK